MRPIGKDARTLEVDIRGTSFGLALLIPDVRDFMVVTEYGTHGGYSGVTRTSKRERASVVPKVAYS